MDDGKGNIRAFELGKPSVNKSKLNDGLCCRCGDIIENHEKGQGGYCDGKWYPACGKCAMILGGIMASEMRNAHKGTAT